MLNVNSDIQSMRSGASAATATSGINQPEVTSALDLQLVKSTAPSASWTESTALPTPPAGHSLVTPSVAEDVLSKLFGGISGEVRSRTEGTEPQRSTQNASSGYPYLSQVNNVDPQAMMMMVTLLSLDASAQKVASMKNSNEIYTDGQNKALDNKTLEFKKQLEEQQKAEEKAQKSKILGQVFGWLGVAVTAIAAIFNPALWAVVAVSATAMALQTAVDVMGDKAPQALKTAAQVFGGVSIAASILTAGIGGVSSLMSKVGDVANKVGDVANKVGSNIVKTVTKLADVFVENVVSKVAATANGFTTSARSIGTTVLNNDSAQYSILAQLSAYAVQNLTRQSENLGESAKVELDKAAAELRNQASYLQNASQLISDSARVNSRIVSGRV
ncbi:TPA: secretion protein EspD [Escherichia coli]|nr:secretion protein EspD [Escherichia coli]